MCVLFFYVVSAPFFLFCVRALEELFDRPIEIYSSEGEDLRPMKIDFDAAGVRVAGEYYAFE